MKGLARDERNSLFRRTVGDRAKTFYTVPSKLEHDLDGVGDGGAAPVEQASAEGSTLHLPLPG